MRLVLIIAAAGSVFAAHASAQSALDYRMSPLSSDVTQSYQVELGANELFALQGALVSLSRTPEHPGKDGARVSEAVPSCLSDTEKKCIPHEMDLHIGRNLRNIQEAITDYQRAARAIQGDETGGVGYADPETREGKAASARANYRLGLLAEKKWPFLYWRMDLRALTERKVAVPGVTRAVLSLVQPDALDDEK